VLRVGEFVLGGFENSSAVLVCLPIGADALDALLSPSASTACTSVAVSSSQPTHGSSPRRLVTRLRMVLRFWFLRSYESIFARSICERPGSLLMTSSAVRLW
jgi:hypothetical protein